MLASELLPHMEHKPVFYARPIEADVKKTMHGFATRVTTQSLTHL